MQRRLYFVIPDARQAGSLVAELERAGVDRPHLHAIARAGAEVGALPAATERQRHDAVWRLERTLWGANMSVFWLAFLGLVAALLSGHSVWSVIAFAVLVATLTAGALFALTVPDTHLDEFRGALAHGDIVLMVDVPKTRVREIEEMVRRRHPEAVAGGTGWTIEKLGI